LYLRNLSAVNPDPRLFPDFDDNLRQAFRRETELFVESIKNEDRSVLDFLNAKYTFVSTSASRSIMESRTCTAVISAASRCPTTAREEGSSDRPAFSW
jgi:hypothetical protein